MEAWALYNAVWVVGLLIYAGTVKSEQTTDHQFE